jgi:DNA-binding SARP family transcriptional activator/Flp pilus assembly protein TadD
VEISEILKTVWLGATPEESEILGLIEECYTLEQAGKMGAALRQGRRALHQARRANHPTLISAALAAMAMVHVHLGHYDQAYSMAEEALRMAPSDSPAKPEALIVMGICASETNDLDLAERCYRQAADVSREYGYMHTLVRSLHNLSAGIYWPRGQFDLALTYSENAAQIAHQHQILRYMRHILTVRGLIYLTLGNYQRVAMTLEQLKECVSPGSLSEGYYYCLKGHLAQVAENIDDSPVDLYRCALSIAEAIGEPGLNIETRLGLSRYYRLQGELPTALAWADQAVHLANQSGYVHIEGRTLIELARVHWAMGDLTTAEADLGKAIELLTSIQAHFDLALARLLVAALLYVQKRDEVNVALWEALQAIHRGGYEFLLEIERAIAFPLIAAHVNHPDSQVVMFCSALLRRLQKIPPPPLTIRTLGGFEVRQGKRWIAVQSWKQRQAGELFRLLLISQQRTLRREQIIDALWPNALPSTAMSAFHQATSALRRVLEPDLPDKFPSRYLIVREGEVTLRLPPGSKVDFELFEQHLQRGEFEEALALYHGELFPEDRYCEWTFFKREYLTQQYLRTLLTVAEQKLAAGQPAEAFQACCRILAENPWHEQAVHIGMQACIQLKDRAGAIRLYRELEQSLAKDLDIAPSPEIQALYRSLR